MCVCHTRSRKAEYLVSSNGYSTASSVGRAIQWLAISMNTYARCCCRTAVMRRLCWTMVSRRQSGVVTPRVLRSCRIVLALRTASARNGRFSNSGSSVDASHHRCADAAFPDPPCSRCVLPVSSTLLTVMVNPPLDELDLSIERPSISHRDILDVRDRRALASAWQTASVCSTAMYSLAFCLSRDLNSRKVRPTCDAGYGMRKRKCLSQGIVKQSVSHPCWFPHYKITPFNL